jgi:PPOX class probable F420-dependent enzyme
MNRRSQIKMTPEEQAAFLSQVRTATLSSIDPRGYPHSVAMWFVMDGDHVLMTTYAKSQKTRNIERNPKVAFMAESGATYDTLKGVLIRGRAEVIHDADFTLGVLKRIQRKMMGALPDDVAEVEDVLRAQAAKRIVLKVSPERVSSWDHGKLAGVY